MSGDGRFVVFASGAHNLVPNDTSLAQGVYVHDRLTGATTLLSVGLDGSPGNGQSQNAAISGNGLLIGFASGAYNLVANNTNFQTDIFVTTWNAPYLLGCFETDVTQLSDLATDVALVDLEGDGDLDLVLGQGLTTDDKYPTYVITRRNDGLGHFSLAQQMSLAPAELKMTFGDVNGDHLADAVFYGWGLTPTLWLNMGGQFSATTQTWLPSDVFELADVDGDGDLDALVGLCYDCHGPGLGIWRNDGYGHFTAGPVIDVPGPDSVSVADVNHDHIADLVIGSSLYHHLYVYQDIGGTYTHTFAFDQGDWGQWRDQVWLGDLNNDTQPDMVWAGYTSDSFTATARAPSRTR